MRKQRCGQLRMTGSEFVLFCSVYFFPCIAESCVFWEWCILGNQNERFLLVEEGKFLVLILYRRLPGASLLDFELVRRHVRIKQEFNNDFIMLSWHM